VPLMATYWLAVVVLVALGFGLTPVGRRYIMVAWYVFHLRIASHILRSANNKSMRRFARTLWAVRAYAAITMPRIRIDVGTPRKADD
jgi:hypothetical protein